MFAKDDDGDFRRALRVARCVDLRAAASRLHCVRNRPADRLAAREVGGGRVGPLPGNGPAARLHRHIVSASARYQHIRARLDRQDRPFILEQHQRFCHGFTRDGKVIGRAQLRRVAAFDLRLAHQAELVLDAQVAPDGVVEPRLRNLARAHVAHQAVEQTLPAVGRHIEVQPGVERGGAIGDGATGNLAMAVPVAHDQPFKPHAPFQHVGQQGGIAMVLDAVPTGETGHDGERARVDRGGIALRMGADQFGFGNLSVALILAILRPAIGQKMLGGGGDAERAQRLARHQLALKSVHHGGGIGFHQCGIGGIAFIAAAPAQILRHGERGREGPFDPRPGDFGGGRLSDAVDEIGVVGRAKADIVRKDGRTRHIAMAMHGVHAKEDGDAHACLH